MSTILQALQKSKLDQARSPSYIAVESNKPQLWKIAVSIALLIIIALLGTLIYLQLNPHSSVIYLPQEKPVIEQPTEKAKPIKMNFDTQPLPLLPEKEESIVEPTPKRPASKITTPKRHQSKPQANTLMANNIESADSADDSIAEQELDYEKVPEALKKRFELALMLTEMEDTPKDVMHSDEPNENIDGSDIRQMSSSFQRKVAPIHYDSHMYSSVLKDRWIRINGEALREGEFDSTGELQVLEIQPQRTIFRLQRQSFSLESLTDWQGY